jgi:hypothetical protein
MAASTSSTAAPSPSPPPSRPGHDTPEPPSSTWPAPSSASRYDPAIRSPCCDDGWNPPRPSGAKRSRHSHLRDAPHADAILCRLVAHHSYAIVEAYERGLADVLSLECEPAPYALSSVLTCCDMTTSPDGELVPVEKRLAEIHDRHGPGHLVSRSIQRATPMIRRAVEQVHDRAARTA